VLHVLWCTRLSCALISHFCAEAVLDFRWEDSARHTNKFGDAALIAADTREYVAHDRFHNAFHWREQNSRWAVTGVVHKILKNK